jgi:glycosyltransferase involved in cell wall biosynthesis
MIKVGFLLNFPLEYKGGINYLKNLFYALNKFQIDKIQIILFVPDDLDNEYIVIFSPFAKIVKTPILKRKSLLWFLSKIGNKYLNYDFVTYNLLKKHSIDIVSHSNFVIHSKSLKTLNWIPDFQYIHFPALWSKNQLQTTKKLHNKLVKKSDKIILSSKAAFEDFKINHFLYQNKVSVLNFVSQPDTDNSFSVDSKEIKNINDTYNIRKSFFYVPNQFWSHKNHLIVFEAVKILRDKGECPLVVTSGLMTDYRNGNNYIKKLFHFVKENKLEENILFLGLIPYSDVNKLVLMSICVINPSFFEGWSSSVEESKTAGKKILLSNIPVHIEQNPEYGIYFNPNNALELAQKMEDIIKEHNINNEQNINKLKINLNNRTKKFSQQYISIIENLMDMSI